MWVIVTHDISDDTRRLVIALIRPITSVIHCVEDSAMDGLEAISNIWEGSTDNDRHGVVEIAARHLYLEINSLLTVYLAVAGTLI
jgi:hypothetical protein